MARLFADGQIIADEWHPLDGCSAPEFIPPTWNAAHCFNRFTDAWRCLIKLPLRGFGPKQFGGMWPHYEYEWDKLMLVGGPEIEQMAVEGRLNYEFAEAYRQWSFEKNSTRILPSAKEISEMDRAMSWPGQYLTADDHMAHCLNLCAWSAAIDVDLDKLISRRRIRMRSEEAIRKICWAACDVVADGLNDDGKETW